MPGVREENGEAAVQSGEECAYVPGDFVDYLLADGVHLRSDSAALPRRAAVDPLDDDSAFVAEEEADSEEEGHPAVRFAEVEKAVTAAISRLGGAVLPKLNWSAPKDAVWVTFSGTLRCSNYEEVVLLLKSSDAVAHDLQHAYAQCCDLTADQAPHTPPQLVLKKWADLKPASEFRLFVRDTELVGACQRHTSDHFPFLADSARLTALRLKAFHEETVADVFPHPNYTYDVYVTSSGGVRLLDFNPWGGATLPLLFSWPELAAVPEGQEPLLRVVESQQAIRPGMRTGVPLELYDTSAGSALSDFIQRNRHEAQPGGGE